MMKDPIDGEEMDPMILFLETRESLIKSHRNLLIFKFLFLYSYSKLSLR